MKLMSLSRMVHHMVHHRMVHTFLNMLFTILPICRSILQILFNQDKITDLRIIIFFAGHLLKVSSVDGKECTTPLDTGLHWQSSVWCTPFSNWSLEQTPGLHVHAILFCLLFVKQIIDMPGEQINDIGENLFIFFFQAGSSSNFCRSWTHEGFLSWDDINKCQTRILSLL